ncbi:MAG: SCE4755 family polysaccharide monooxygenase-like protein [Myxococcota bacterium]
MRALLFAALIATPGIAFAHAGLVSPESRDNDPQSGTSIKTGPCGPQGPGSGPRTTFVAGTTVDIHFRETVNHAGHFMLSLSMANDQGFTVLDGNIPHSDAAPQPTFGSPRMYTYQWTVPNTPCTTCTLQLIQVMEDRNPPTNYYSCADIEIDAPGQPDAGVPEDTGIVMADADTAPDLGAAPPPDSGVTGAPDAGMVTVPDAGAVAVADAGTQPAASGGCSTSSPSALGSTLSILVFGLGLASMRLRRR